MPLKLIKREGRTDWYLHGTVRGQRIRESAGTDNREAAEAIRIKREAEVLDRTIHGPKATATWLEAVEVYLTKGGDETFIEKLNAKLAGTKLADINSLAMLRLQKVLYPKLKPSSLNRVLYTPVIAVLRSAAEAGLCALPAIKRPKPGDKRVRWISHEEAERLIAACSATAYREHLRVLVIFLLGTGARLSEALYLDWRNVDLDRGQVTFVHAPEQGYRTKTERSRGVPLHARVIAELRKLPHREGAVFLTHAGKPYARRHENRQGGGQIKVAFDAACKDAGIANFRPHDCRHTWATWLYQATRDPQRLMMLGGWSSLDMVQRYAHVNVEQHAQAIDAALDAAWGGAAKPALRAVS